MRRAAEFRAYRDVKYFQPPSGVVSIQIDPDSGMPATPQCPKKINEYFISGTEPVGSCPLHGGNSPDNTNVSGWDTPQRPPAGKTSSGPTAGQPAAPGQSVSAEVAQPEAPENGQEPKKKRGILGRIFKRD